MPSPAMTKALDHVSDEFRPERQQRRQIILQGHRVMSLVEAGRYSFPEACRLMEVDEQKITDAHLWLFHDNARMNDIFDTDIHFMSPADYVMTGWFAEQQRVQHSATVIDFMTAIGRAQVMQREIEQ